MKYQQLTSHERYIISALRKQGLNQSDIARSLGRHRSTISREFSRNCCWIIDDAYRPSKAQRRTVARRKRTRRNHRYCESDFAIVHTLLRKQLSPEQIVGYLRSINQKSFSHETLYLYIWRDKAAGGNLWTQLRGAQKKRRKRYRAYDSRGRLADKRHISERPKSVESKRVKGHWEIDTVMGKGSLDCIVTLVERKTGFAQIGKLKDRTTHSLNKKTISLIRRDPDMYKTITSDNGTEFHQYKVIEQACDTKFYFANPYHSWERGANENMNGLIRQYLPKGTSMENLTQKQCNAIANKLNSRPRAIAYKSENY